MQLARSQEEEALKAKLKGGGLLGRCLFGPLDPVACLNQAREQQQKDASIFCERWNLKGIEEAMPETNNVSSSEYQWEKISGEDVVEELPPNFCNARLFHVPDPKGKKSPDAEVMKMQLSVEDKEEDDEQLDLEKELSLKSEVADDNNGSSDDEVPSKKRRLLLPPPLTIVSSGGANESAASSSCGSSLPSTPITGNASSSGVFIFPDQSPSPSSGLRCLAISSSPKKNFKQRRITEYIHDGKKTPTKKQNPKKIE